MKKNKFYEITICTVCTDDEKLIQKNIEYISKLNDNIKINWIICLNKERDVKINLDNFKSNIEYIYGLPKDLIGSIALHHSIGLNLTKKKIKTQYAVFIDPDFFVLRKNFFNDIIDYILENRLNFIGVPWHPKWYSKFRYFPCSHFLIVDTYKISLDNFDFRPIDVFWDKKYSNLNHIKLKKNIFSRIIHKFFSYNNFLYYNFFYRNLNCFDGDTSHRIYINLHKSKNKYEIFSTCFDITEDWLIPISWKINNFIELFLPENLCFFPKDRSKIKFNSKFGNYLSKYAYEGFYWKDNEIGFHVRGHPKRFSGKRDNEKEVQKVVEIYNKFFSKNL